jgi:PhnB protein
MNKQVRAIPQGYHSLTPCIVVKGAAQVIEFCERAFGAEERMRFPGPNGTVAHAEIKIGDSTVMLGDLPQGEPPRTASLMLYVDDCDAVFKRAIDAGAKVRREMKDQFYGDRSGTVGDPFGNEWTISTHKEDVSNEELQRRMKAFEG